MSVLVKSLSSIDNIANHAANVGRLPAFINRLPATTQLVSRAFSLSEFAVSSPIVVESPPNFPCCSWSFVCKIKRKVQFSEAEVRARFSAVRGVTSVVVSLLGENLFAERSNMERICEILREFDSLRLSLAQLFAIGKSYSKFRK